MKLLNLSEAQGYRVWESALADLTDAELRRGLIAARDFTGFFSLPAFRELCKTVDLQAQGLPTALAAYEEACLKPTPKLAQKWSHPAVYHAGRLTGWSDLHAMPRDQIFKRFEYNYSILCKRIAEGEDINLDVPQAIPRTINRRCTTEENIRHLAELRATVGI